MLKTLKILFIVLGLGIFTLPTQMVFAQSPVEHCEQKADSKDCCSSKKPSNCHSKTTKDPKKEDCGNDCNDCKSCTVNFVMNFLSPEFKNSTEKNLFVPKSNFDYSTSYFSSAIQNIWQPPKIS
ncbi:hypothetical protein [Kaistella polysaccharea]|uniref:hypothetical protein n=1 Tax=Kaistella polysaccharea TaxID=2878534 RepID=UPI001CF37895|nr:hypothetical protein [Kaistella polysaccharea]